jgi:hypothetical protein
MFFSGCLCCCSGSFTLKHFIAPLALCLSLGLGELSAGLLELTSQGTLWTGLERHLVSVRLRFPRGAPFVSLPFDLSVELKKSFDWRPFLLGSRAAGVARTFLRGLSLLAPRFNLRKKWIPLFSFLHFYLFSFLHHSTYYNFSYFSFRLT